MHMMRTAVDHTTVGAARVRAGDRVVIWLPSCNRDESVFADPHEFRVDRQPNPHLSLGVGPHYCIGAPLARAEVRSFVAAMLRLVASVELTGQPVRQRSNFLNGLSHLAVRMVLRPGD